MPDGSRTRSTRTSGHQATSLPFARARKPEASRPSSDTKARETNPTEKSEPISSRRARATPSTSDVRASSAAIRRRLSSSRSRSGEIAASGRRRADRDRAARPIDEAEREHAEQNGDALPGKRKAVQADGKRLDPGHAGRRDSTERRTLPSSVFRLQRGIPPRSKDGSTGPLWAQRGRDSVPRTGRCEPRARTWPCNPR